MKQWIQAKAVAAAAAFLLLPALAAPVAAQQPAVVVDTVVVRGNVRVSEELIRGQIGLARGDTVRGGDIPELIRRLYATGQFADVKVFAGSAVAAPDAPVALTVEVREQPIIGIIEFKGLEHVSGRTIRDTVDLNTGEPLRLSKVAAAKAMTRELLAQKGFLVRSVEHRLEPLEGTPGEYRLIFDVDEGGRVAIAQVRFEGNDVFNDERLRDVMETKQEGFLWFRGGTYDEEKVRTDVRANLPRFYGEHGYIDFAVTGDTLMVDPETGKAALVISVSEGQQYRLLGFEIEGNKNFATEDLQRYFEPERSRGLLGGLPFGGRDTLAAPVFDAAAFEEATQQVSQRYRNQGYLYAQIEPVVERTTTESGQPAVRVSWQIQEGEPAYINRVAIVGNTFTHENVIRERILLLPGDVYNEELLLQSYRSVSGLGFFETPVPLPRIEPTETGDVNVTFAVKEKQTGSVNFGTAIGGGTGIAGFLGYDHPNLFGKAKAGHLRWEFGRYSNNFSASYSDPAIRDSRISGTFSVFSARNNFTRTFRFSEGEQRRTGASVRLGFPVPQDRFSRLFVGYSLSRTEYEQFGERDGQSLFSLRPGVQSTFSLGLARNTLDHPLFPTAGTRHQLEAELSGGPLGGTGDFQKYTYTGNWFVPIGQLGGGAPQGRPVRFTLGLTGEGGFLAGDASGFPFERFWMGGVQFGRPLRGYDETTITPLGYFPRGATGIKLEDRFGDAFVRLSGELAARVSDAFSLSMFYDAGNVWRDPGAVNPTRLLRGAGLGVTLVTPFGPLGLDYAYGFDKTVPGWQLHFKLGQGF